MNMDVQGSAPFTEHLGLRALKPRKHGYDSLHICVVRGAMPGAEAHFRDRMLACWFEGGNTTLVFESPHENAVRAFLSERCREAEFLWEGRMPYGNWEAGAPVVATHESGFLICPSWDLKEPCACEARIILDPGLAFGSGLHPATRVSLALLRRVMEHQKPRRVLDLGCGTGVLAIAALLLGAQHSVAVDYSLLAENAARINAELNGVDHKMEIIHGDLFSHLGTPADLVLCNMNFPLFEKLLTSNTFLSHQWILMSGINPQSMHTAILGKLADLGMDVISTARRGEWFGYLIQGRT